MDQTYIHIVGVAFHQQEFWERRNNFLKPTVNVFNKNEYSYENGQRLS